MSKAEKFIKDYTRGCSNELCAVEDRYGKKVLSYHEWLTPEQALAAVKIAREEMIDNACNYLFSHIGLFVRFFDDDIVEDIERSDFIKGFRQAMEG